MPQKMIDLPQHPVVLFDGVCNLCHSSVQWVLRRDTSGHFRFASLQSGTAQALLQAHGVSPHDFQSVVLLHKGRLYTQSDAALGIARLLGGGWAWLAAFFQLVPRRLRDAVYQWVARNRYRWFGKKEACWLPRAEWRERFLE